ncbi:PREDICTED: uncharacterized protein LOC105455171 [Wasmannia auropunctata]|uniref:uncharacterized protein LOC105455171 n=1 Tax=Wasmannia auropunctata TaxID=64793 RepID=UPI0005EF21EB|nr:PREDICTED: uncharacterized protein LOC105455171 [Wasmannia auropunctata]XP_011696591.1 PREDICTED: uncharacterized protein LOC105455171 [Wasmannia auropunctata]
MTKTWTVVRFKDENVVEAVPTNWIASGKCYWPPYTKEKILKAIKDHIDFDSSWTSYEVYVFKNSTSESYQACRLKAKKAEDTSDLSSDYHKKRTIKKKNRIYESDSSEFESDTDNTMLPSPPDFQEHSDTEINTLKKISRRSGTVNTCVEESQSQKNTFSKNISFDMRHDSFNNNESRPLQMCRTGKENTSVKETYDDCSNNVPGSSNIRVYTANEQQKYSQKDVNIHKYNASSSTNAYKQIFTDSNLCTCCPEHKNYGTYYNALNIFN